MEQTINYITLLVGITSIVLAIIAIWLVIAFKKQSDDINRDTTGKLARIEAFAKMTKEDAFIELSKWGDFARTGGKLSEEVEKIKEKELEKLKDELRNSTSQQINKLLQTVESRLNVSAKASDIAKIRNEFKDLKKDISEIQDKAVSSVKSATVRHNILTLISDLSHRQLEMLREAAKYSGWIPLDVLESRGYSESFILNTIDRLRQKGLIKSRIADMPDSCPQAGLHIVEVVFTLDEALKKTLLEEHYEME